MKKVFISLPMRGKTLEEINLERNRCLDIISERLEEPVYLLNSLHEGEASPVWKLSYAIRVLSGADLVFFSRGWDTARGCKIEHKICEEYDIPFMEEVDIF